MVLRTPPFPTTTDDDLPQVSKSGLHLIVKPSLSCVRLKFDMAPSNPTILSIFQPETSAANAVLQESAAPFVPGDAFTAEEIERSLDPLSCGFNPSREYAHVDIGGLIPGPKAVTFFGRIVNFNVHHGRSKSHAAATGWHNLIVKDDTGAICV
jgi:hypothetical protein